MLIRHTVCRFLEDRGFEVKTATNGQEALEALRRVKPDLIITDLQMPKMSGGELIAAVRAEKATAKIPIVVVSSQKNGAVESDQRADFTIRKDIDIQDQLALALERTLGACPSVAVKK